MKSKGRCISMKTKKEKPENEEFEPKKTSKTTILAIVVVVIVVVAALYIVFKPNPNNSVTGEDKKVSIEAPKQSYVPPKADTVLVGMVFEDGEGIKYSFKKDGIVNVDGESKATGAVFANDGLSYTLQDGKVSITNTNGSSLTGTLSEDKNTITSTGTLINVNGGTALTRVATAASSSTPASTSSEKTVKGEVVSAEAVGKVSDKTSTSSSSTTEQPQNLSKYADSVSSANSAASEAFDKFFVALINANKMSANVSEIEKQVVPLVVNKNTFSNSVKKQYFQIGTQKTGKVSTSVTGTTDSGLNFMAFVPITVSGSKLTALFYVTTNPQGTQILTVSFQGTNKG